MGVPRRATYMSAGLQDLKIVLFAHLEQEDFLLGQLLNLKGTCKSVIW